MVREGARRWSTLAMYPGMARVTVWSFLSKTIEKPRYFAPDQSTVIGFSAWRVLIRWSTSSLVVYLTPKSSTRREKTVPLDECRNRQEVLVWW